MRFERFEQTGGRTSATFNRPDRYEAGQQPHLPASPATMALLIAFYVPIVGCLVQFEIGRLVLQMASWAGPIATP
jgi:hypothetical protein